MDHLILIGAFLFLIVRWAKTYLFLQNFSKYDSIKSYFIVPELILFLTFLYHILRSGESIEGPSKIVLLVCTVLGAIASSIGLKWRNKIAMVLSIMLFMYVFGITLTKSYNFMMP